LGEEHGGGDIGAGDGSGDQHPDMRSVSGGFCGAQEPASEHQSLLSQMVCEGRGGSHERFCEIREQEGRRDGPIRESQLEELCSCHGLGGHHLAHA